MKYKCPYNNVMYIASEQSDCMVNRMIEQTSWGPPACACLVMILNGILSIPDGDNMHRDTSRAHTS